MLEGTYVAPHRHAAGAQAGDVRGARRAGGGLHLYRRRRGGGVRVAGEGAPEGRVAVDLPAGVWHTLAVLTPHAVLVEVKPGFYDPATDKQFAPWAPREGEPGAGDYLEKLVTLARNALTAGR